MSVAAGVSETGPKFFGLAFSHNAHSGASSGFSFDNAVASGLLDSPQGQLIDEYVLPSNKLRSLPDTHVTIGSLNICISVRS